MVDASSFPSTHLETRRKPTCATSRDYHYASCCPFEREVIARYGRNGRKLVNLGRDRYAALLLASLLTGLKRGE